MREITTVVIHHSVTPRDLALSKSVSSFSRSHWVRLHPQVNSLWYHIAYHYVIAGNGEWKKTRGLNEIGYHASNRPINQKSVAICMTWNFDVEHPTQAQIDVVNYLISELEKKLGRLDIRFHNEFATKTCPWKNVTKTMFHHYEEPKDTISKKKMDIVWEIFWDLGTLHDTVESLEIKKNIEILALSLRERWYKKY